MGGTGSASWGECNGIQPLRRFNTRAGWSFDTIRFRMRSARTLGSLVLLFSRLLKKSKPYISWISARPAVTPYQQLPNPHSEVGLDRRASRRLFQQAVSRTGVSPVSHLNRQARRPVLLPINRRDALFN